MGGGRGPDKADGATHTRWRLVAGGVIAIEAPQRLTFTNDSQHRRVRKVVRNADFQSGEWKLVSNTRFLYDGWNVIAEFESSTGVPTVSGASVPLVLRQTYAWASTSAARRRAREALAACCW